jgi:hypothetical protein
VDFPQRTLAGRTLRQLAGQHAEVRQLLASHQTHREVRVAIEAASTKDLVGQPVRLQNDLMPL